MAALGLCCCMGFSLVVVSRGYCLAMLHRLLVTVACSEVNHQLWGTPASAEVVVPET